MNGAAVPKIENNNPLTCVRQAVLGRLRTFFTQAGPRTNTRNKTRTKIWACGLIASVVFGAAGMACSAEQRHALTMHGEPALPAGFTRLPYVNPDAPKGGRLTYGLLGTFDSLNPLIVKGIALGNGELWSRLCHLD